MIGDDAAAAAAAAADDDDGDDDDDDDVVDDDGIDQKLVACQENFDTIAKRCRAFENVTVQQLIVCVTKVPKKPHYQQYIMRFASNLVQCTTVTEFIDTLCSLYSNFIFYHLLEKVVITYGNLLLRSYMEIYKEKLISIIATTKATECTLCSTNLKSTEISTVIVIGIHIPLLDCRVSDIVRVKNEIRNICYMFELCHIVEISGDSTTTTVKWSLPDVFCRYLQVDVLLSSIPFKPSMGSINASASTLEMCGVLKMIVDGLCVFEYDPQNNEVGTNYCNQ